MSWSELPTLLDYYLQKCAGVYYHVKELLQGEPAVIWLDVDNENLATDSRSASTKLASAGYSCLHTSGQLDSSRPWMAIKTAEWPASSVFYPLAQIANLAPAPWNKPFGGPTPLAATLTGGALGAGMGYLGGTVAEHLLPADTIQRGRLRKTLAVLGGLTGAVPGFYLGTVAQRMHTDPNTSSFNAWMQPNPLFGSKVAALASSLLDEVVGEDALHPWIKKGWDDAGGAGALFMPSIPVDAFNRTIMADPFAPQELQAATMGVTQAAANSKGTGIISPYDIARIGMGMGAGLTQAYLGGKVLGALAGLTPQAQQTLQQTGMFAGALKAVVPGLFGG